VSQQDVLKDRFEALRASEYRRLDDGGHVYLDYTGSGIYAESQVRSHTEFLQARVLGNPHSANPASAAATIMVHQARMEVLDFFGADPEEYTVIFTANASAALKLVGESFPFGPDSIYCLMEDAHNSVNGIRVYADGRGASTHYVTLGPDLRQDPENHIPAAGSGPSLFTFPAQSNFSGVRHPLGLVKEAQEKGYRVLLDSAAYVPTSRLDLSALKPDYVAVSFYKMFGFPTGVGALIARRDCLGELERPWFGGGTVEFVSVQNSVHQLALGAEAFEDGTLNFLAICALPAGFAILRRVGMESLHDRVDYLTERLLNIMTSLSHDDGSPMVELYGPSDLADRGGTVAFNLLDAHGQVVPFSIVEREAGAQNISLRGGCFCNPGAAEVAFGLPAEQALACFMRAPRGSFTLNGFAECMEYEVAVGALRASVGIATTDADLDRLDAFLAGFRNQESPWSMESAEVGS